MHPLTAQLDTYDSPRAVLEILRFQAQVFGKDRKGNDRLMEWLGPTVDILFVFSSMLVEGIGLVSTLYLSLIILGHQDLRLSRPLEQSLLVSLFFSG